MTRISGVTSINFSKNSKRQTPGRYKDVKIFNNIFQVLFERYQIVKKKNKIMDKINI